MFHPLVVLGCAIISTDCDWWLSLSLFFILSQIFSRYFPLHTPIITFQLQLLMLLIVIVIVFPSCTIYLADTPATPSHFLILLSKLSSSSCIWSHKNKETEEDKVINIFKIWQKQPKWRLGDFVRAFFFLRIICFFSYDQPPPGPHNNYFRQFVLPFDQSKPFFKEEDTLPYAWSLDSRIQIHPVDA